MKHTDFSHKTFEHKTLCASFVKLPLGTMGVRTVANYIKDTQGGLQSIIHELVLPDSPCEKQRGRGGWEDELVQKALKEL